MQLFWFRRVNFLFTNGVHYLLFTSNALSRGRRLSKISFTSKLKLSLYILARDLGLFQTSCYRRAKLARL